MHGLPVMTQEVGAVAGGDVGSGNGECATAVAEGGWGLGGTGPVLKTQTIVSVVGRSRALRQSHLRYMHRDTSGTGAGLIPFVADKDASFSRTVNICLEASRSEVRNVGIYVQYNFLTRPQPLPTWRLRSYLLVDI